MRWEALKPSLFGELFEGSSELHSLLHVQLVLGGHLLLEGGLVTGEHFAARDQIGPLHAGEPAQSQPSHKLLLIEQA